MFVSKVETFYSAVKIATSVLNSLVFSAYVSPTILVKI